MAKDRAYNFEKSELSYWINTTKKQYHKDRCFVRTLERHLVSGEILELGAGCGGLSRILHSNHGYEVMASDFADFFVDYMRSINLNAMKIDATNIQEFIQKAFPNIITQGLVPLYTRDLSVVATTYLSIYDTLKPGGRFVFVFPSPIINSSKRFNSVQDHYRIINTQTAFKIIDVFRNQLFPSRFYTIFPERIMDILERTLGRHFGHRVVFVLEK